jgi:hypothetical protein
METAMKASKKLGLALVAAAAALMTAGSAFAWGHSRVSIGFGFGFPSYYYPAPYYYPPAYPYYYPTPVVVQQQPQTYVERPDAAPEAQNYWYYCAESKIYYPYVKQCPGGWQRVQPSPPPG